MKRLTLLGILLCAVPLQAAEVKFQFQVTETFANQTTTWGAAAYVDGEVTPLDNSPLDDVGSPGATEHPVADGTANVTFTLDLSNITSAPWSKPAGAIVRVLLIDDDTPAHVAGSQEWWIDSDGNKYTINDRQLNYFQLLARRDAALGTTDAITALNELNRDEGSGAGTYDNSVASMQRHLASGTAGQELVAVNADQSVDLVDGFTTGAKTEIRTEANNALVANHLNYLFATSYNPAATPGNSGALMNALTENDGAGAVRYTTKALEQSPTGSGGWTTQERNEIRYRLGVDGTTATPATNIPHLETVDANVISFNSDSIGAETYDLGLAFRTFFDVQTPTQTMENVGASAVAADIWSYPRSSATTIGSMGEGAVAVYNKLPPNLSYMVGTNDVNGNLDLSTVVNAFPANVITAASITSSAFTSDKFANNSLTGAATAQSMVDKIQLGLASQASLDVVNSTLNGIRNDIPTDLTPGGYMKSEPQSMSLTSLQNFVLIDTTYTSAQPGSVAKISQGSGGLDEQGVRDAIGMAAANMDIQLGDIPNNAEFNARTLPSANYFDPTTDAVANVTTVATLTGHTPQTGDTFAQLPTNFDVLAISAAGSADALVQGYLNTLITETTAGRIAGNQSTFWDNNNAATTSVVDDVQALDVQAIVDGVYDEPLASHIIVGSGGERWGRIPNANPGTAGGMATVDASNYIAGIQGTKNTLDDLNDATAEATLWTTTIATINTQTNFTLSTGSSDDNAYKDLVVVITNNTDATQITRRTVASYVGATKTMSISATPDFTIGVGDIVDIYAQVDPTTSGAIVSGGGVNYRTAIDSWDREAPIPTAIQGQARQLTIFVEATGTFANPSPTLITAIVADSQGNSVTVTDSNITRVCEDSNYQIIRFTLNPGDTSLLEDGFADIQVSFDSEVVQLREALRIIPEL